MNFEFSEEQLQLRETARNFLGKQCTRRLVRESIERKAPFDEHLWKNMAAMGWQGTVIPEQYGGLGYGYLELAVLAEEVGRSLAPVPFSSSVYLASEAILRGGAEEIKQQYLPSLADGSLKGAFATQEKVSQPRPPTITTEYTDGQLYGFKVAVMDGDIADLAVVTCIANGRRKLAVVELAGKSVTKKRLTSLDLTRGLASLEFSGAPALLLDESDSKSGLSHRVADSAATLLAFELIGGAQQCLYDARDYALQRYAFGRKIGSFQAIKHKLADLYVLIELARSNSYYAIWALASGAKDFPVAAAAAYVGAAKAYRLVAQESLHIYGGLGYTWECDSHLFLRRAMASGLALGPIRRWKHVLVERLMGERVNEF